MTLNARFGVVLAALGACVSCTDSTASNPTSYTAISWDGVNTPVQFFCNPFSDTTSWIYRAELFFQSPDSLRVTVYLLVAQDPSQPIYTWVQQDRLAYTWSGDSLVTPYSAIGGARSGKNIGFTMAYPVPPSCGYSQLTHRFVFAP